MAAPEAPKCYAGVDRDSAAFRLMKQMGWEEGEGLGKEKQGIKRHIKASDKKDTAGLGVDKASNNWVFDTTQFDSILKKLKVQVAETNKQEELTIDQDHSESVKDLVVDAPVAKATRPQGRYKRRERGKIVNAYSEKDIQGILVKGKTIEEDCNTNVEVCDEPVNTSSDSEVIQEVASGVKEENAQWWGLKYGFVSGGFLGSKLHTTKTATQKDSHCSSKKRDMFNEEDQENLYKLVQDKATSGKQGLGIKEKPRKIAGCDWKGKKTSFGDSDDDESNDSEKQNDDEPSEDETIIEPKIKLKKLCRQLLRQAPSQTLKLKQLKAHIDLHSSSVFSGFSCKRDALTYLKSKLGGSKFILEGKMVRLTE